MVFTIDIECGITIAIGIDGLCRSRHHTVLTIFLVECITSGKLQPIGLARLASLTEEIATIEIQQLSVDIVGDIDDIVTCSLCSTGDFRWTVNEDERLIRRSRCCLNKGIGIPIVVGGQWTAP